MRYQQATSLIFKVRGKPQSLETITMRDIQLAVEAVHKITQFTREIAL